MAEVLRNSSFKQTSAKIQTRKKSDSPKYKQLYFTKYLNTENIWGTILWKNNDRLVELLCTLHGRATFAYRTIQFSSLSLPMEPRYSSITLTPNAISGKRKGCWVKGADMFTTAILTTATPTPYLCPPLNCLIHCFIFC